MRTLLTLAAALCIASASPSWAQTVLPLWPAGPPGGQTVPAGEHERDLTTPTDPRIAGKRVERIGFVSVPTLTVYRPAAQQETGAAVVVFPGGGYQLLAWDLEGTEVCQWLNSLGITCALLKYRVPDAGPFPQHTQDLADAQRSMRMVRAHAAEWHVDPKRVGVLGFSAGGHLAAVLASHSGDTDTVTQGTVPDAVDKQDAAPNFSVLIYPGYLSGKEDLHMLPAEVQPGPGTPPTFLVQAEDDPVHVENVLNYYQALKDAKIPAEMHVYAAGGHGYGLRPTELPVTHWPELATTWFKTVYVLPAQSGR